jgi:hypothetical protein
MFSQAFPFILSWCTRKYFLCCLKIVFVPFLFYWYFYFIVVLCDGGVLYFMLPLTFGRTNFVIGSLLYTSLCGHLTKSLKQNSIPHSKFNVRATTEITFADENSLTFWMFKYGIWIGLRNIYLKPNASCVNLPVNHKFLVSQFRKSFVYKIIFFFKFH